MLDRTRHGATRRDFIRQVRWRLLRHVFPECATIVASSLGLIERWGAVGLGSCAEKAKIIATVVAGAVAVEADFPGCWYSEG